MKKYKCTVERTDEYIIEFDENVINEEWMEDFRKYFYKYNSLSQHAEMLAQFRARFPETSFIEGYGRVKVNGQVPFFFGESRGRGDCEDAINIRIISEDKNCDVDVEEIE